MKTLLIRLVREEDGQNLVEYALLAGLVALVATVAVTSVGTKISDVYNALATKLETIKP